MFRIKSANILTLLLTLAVVFTTALPAFASGKDTISVRNAKLPDQLYYREPFELSGSIRSQNSLSRVILHVCTEDGDTVFLKTFRIGQKTFSLRTVNSYLDFAELPCGAYTLTVEVKNKSVGQRTVIQQDFTINDPYVTTSFADTESLVLAFSLKEDGDRYISENFRIKEFACNDGSDLILIDRKLVALLQAVRSDFNAPTTITSGFRSPSYNSEVPNAKSNSYHTKGMAADICVSGVSPLSVARYAESLGANGIGWYDTDKDGHFTHVDTRPSSKRFYWRTQQTIGVSTFYAFG